MHRPSKVKRAWVPTVVRRNGAHTATTQARLEHLAAELDQFWQTDVVDTQGPAAFQDEDEGMPDITAEALTEAAAQIRATSVAAADGFHPRHFGMVALAGSRAICHLLSVAEALAEWPQALRFTMAALIPKGLG